MHIKFNDSPQWRIQNEEPLYFGWPTRTPKWVVKWVEKLDGIVKKNTGRGYGHIVGKHTYFVIGRFALCAFATYLSGFLDWVFIVAGKIIELRRY